MIFLSPFFYFYFRYIDDDDDGRDSYRSYDNGKQFFVLLWTNSKNKTHGFLYILKFWGTKNFSLDFHNKLTILTFYLVSYFLF